VSRSSDFQSEGDRARRANQRMRCGNASEVTMRFSSNQNSRSFADVVESGFREEEKVKRAQE
jgi:hypothetical protein